MIPLQGTQVRSLLGELRSCMQHGVAKKTSEGEQRDKFNETTQGPKRTSQHTGHSTEMDCFCKKLRAMERSEEGTCLELRDLYNV